MSYKKVEKMVVDRDYFEQLEQNNTDLLGICKDIHEDNNTTMDFELWNRLAKAINKAEGRK